MRRADVNDHRPNIVEGPPRFRWPWSRGTDLDIGSQAAPRGGSALGDSTVSKSAQVPHAERARIRRALQPATIGPSATAGLRALPVQAVVLVALAYHLLGPGAAFLTGSDAGARGLLSLVDTVMPTVGEFDPARWLIPGAAAWMWQPLLAVGGAALLRLTALNAAQRDPLSAIWIAAAATAVDTATWLFMGLKLAGTTFTPEEAAALVTLLKVEGGALLVLFFVLAPRGRTRPGETGADQHGVR